ncbi:MAG: class I SAM-dependent methyltransferase [Tepidisphaeraceae bacterium]|jgi:SAM-dependent methyltransferase
MFGGKIRDRFPIIEQYCRTGAVLDLGCVDSRIDRGSAADRIAKPNLLFKRISEINPDVVGLDIDADGIKLLQEMGFKAVCGNAETVDLQRKFDVIVAGEIIEHLENPGLFLRNMLRHLSGDGVLIISTPNPFYSGFTWKIWRYGRPMIHEEHMGWQDPTTMDQLLRRTGFEPFERYWIQPPRPLHKVWKTLFRPYFCSSFMTLARPAKTSVVPSKI